VKGKLVKTKKERGTTEKKKQKNNHKSGAYWGGGKRPGLISKGAGEKIMEWKEGVQPRYGEVGEGGTRKEPGSRLQKEKTLGPRTEDWGSPPGREKKVPKGPGEKKGMQNKGREKLKGSVETSERSIKNRREGGEKLPQHNSSRFLARRQ